MEGACKGKKDKGFFSVAFHSFSLALRFTCPLQIYLMCPVRPLYSSTRVLEYVAVLGCSVGVLPGTFFPRWRLALSGRGKDEGLTLSEYR